MGLLMDKSGQYRAELTSRVQTIAVGTFKKVQSDEEKKEVAKMMHAWRVLRIFEASILDAITTAIRAGGARAGEILDEAANADDEDEEFPDVVEPDPSVPLEDPPVAHGIPVEPKPKRSKTAADENGNAAKVVAEVRQAPFVRLSK